MSFHTKRSPSKAKRTIHCSGNYALCDTLPEHQRNTAGEAARIGSATHGLIEKCLKEGKEPSDFADRIIELVGEEEGATMLKPNAKTPGPGRVFYVVDADMIEGATVCTDYARKRCEELGIPESALQLETRTNPLPDRDDTSGTADITIDAWPALLEVADYKNGWNIVEANSDQATAYLLGKAIEDDFSHEAYMQTIIQPNAPHEDGRIRSITLTKEQLLAWQAKYRAAVERCEEAEADFAKVAETEEPHQAQAFAEWADKWLVAGDHCMFCDSEAVCPAKKLIHQKQAKIDFADEPNEIRFDNRNGEVTQILKWLPQFESFAKQVYAYAQREMEAGFKIDGQKLVQRGAHRKFREDYSEGQIVATIIKGGFVKDKAKLYTAPELKTGPSIEKLVERKRRKEFDKALLYKPEAGLTIAPEDDPRPPVKRSAADDFGDFEDDGGMDFG